MKADERPFTEGETVYARKPFIYGGVSYSPGDEFDVSQCGARKRDSMFAARKLSHSAPAASKPIASPVLTAKGGGWIEIAFGGAVRKARGRAKAEAVAAEMVTA